ncbi:hypothetical protein F5B21DRAFT_525499 [Xylaria acuta]|nr:hypothetical protein F5B21DRAFT_525499 [Xylaria acuta]
MSSEQKKIYSQGFNFGSFVQKGVDPRTEARNCPPLLLSLSHNPLSSQDVGLGYGWSFNLTIFLSTGEHYQAEETSSGVSVKDQKLQSFSFKKLVTTENNGKKTTTYQLYNGTGRSLKLVWTASGEQPRLSKIQDGGEDLLSITYTAAGADIVRNPNTSEASTLTIKRANDGQGQAAWTFTYEKFEQGLACLSNLRYKEKGHRLPSGAPYTTIPYPAIKTNYSYSDYNFLGYSGCHDWDDGSDNLYRAPDDYQYFSTVKVQGGTETKYTYNKFHLLVNTVQQKGTKQITQSNEYHALKNTKFKDQPAQYQLPKTVQTTYRDTATKASRTETSHHKFDVWGNPIQEIKANGIKTDRTYYPAVGDTDSNGGESQCPGDPNGFQRYLKEEIVTPTPGPYTAPTRSKRYIYQNLPTAAGSCPSRYFVAAKEVKVLEDGRPISNTGFSFVNKPAARDHSRPYPKIVDWTYQHPNANTLVEITENKTFDGLAVRDETGYSTLSGSAIFHIDPSGNESVLQYDKINRLVSMTFGPHTSYEATRKYQYAIWGEGGKAGGCRVTVTDPKGVKVRQITDGLERVCRVESQDDDGQWSVQGDVTTYGGTFRLVQERNYNSLGQCAQVVDVDWLRNSEKGDSEPTKQHSSQQFEYDDWGQRCKVTRSSGAVTHLVTDPISSTYTEGIEGEGKVEMQLDLFHRPTRRRLLDRNGNVHSAEHYYNDGLGRPAVKKDPAGHLRRFKYGNFDRIEETIWPDNHVTEVQYAAQSTAALPVSIAIGDESPFAKQTFDGLDRLLETTLGGRSARQTYQGNTPKPACITMPNGSTRNHTYDSALNHALTKTVRADGTDTYFYDTQTLAMKQYNDAHSEDDLQYLPSGMPQAETFKTQGDGTSVSAHSTYSMAGKLQYYEDVHGETHEMQYDSFGRPKKLMCGKVNATFSYDKADRLCESCVTDKISNVSISTSIKYNDFGHEVERVIVRSDDNKRGQTLYRLGQGYENRGLVTTREWQDGNSNVLRKESFQYDSLDRLVDYQCSGTDSDWLPVDEKGHQLKQQKYTFNVHNSLTQVSTVFQDGKSNTVGYKYSDDDAAQVVEITNTHADFMAKILLTYDANGCLTRDEQGRNLEYDTMSRLIAVRDSNQQVVSQYRYDATGKLVSQTVPGQSATQFYYRDDALIAIKKGNEKTSYVFDGSTYWGQTTATDHNDGSKGTTNLASEIFASDFHQSVLASVNSATPSTVTNTRYNPYGFGTASTSSTALPSIGYNGQWRDPVTGWYHLGNGYRVYNPVLMRFHAPDEWSPFTSGEVNAYGYCSGDPINMIDPSGHLSIFGHEITGRDLTIAGVGLTVGIAVGILTCGAGLAVIVGAGIAAGILSDVATGAVYDWASGKSPTLESVGTDAMYGAIGGVLGEGIGMGLGLAAGGHPSAIEEAILDVAGLERRIRKYEAVGNAEERARIPSYKRQIAQIEEREVWRYTVANNAVTGLDRGAEGLWRKYHRFRNYIVRQRVPPLEAAARVSSNVKPMRGAPDGLAIFRFKLSGRDRVVFELRNLEVIIRRIGGHY